MRRRNALLAMGLLLAAAGVLGSSSAYKTSASLSQMQDDAGCTASQVVRRNAGDTAFECAGVVGTGDVVGTASSTNNGIVSYNGTGGKSIQPAGSNGSWKLIGDEIVSELNYPLQNWRSINFKRVEDNLNVRGFAIDSQSQPEGYPSGFATDHLFQVNYGMGSSAARLSAFMPAWNQQWEANFNGGGGAVGTMAPILHEQHLTLTRASHTVPLTSTAGFANDENIAVLAAGTNVVRATGIIKDVTNPVTTYWWAWQNQSDPANGDTYRGSSVNTTSNGTGAFAPNQVAWVFAGNCAASVGETDERNATARLLILNATGAAPTQTITFLPVRGDVDNIVAGKCVKQFYGQTGVADLTGAITTAHSTTINGALTDTGVNFRTRASYGDQLNMTLVHHEYAQYADTDTAGPDRAMFGYGVTNESNGLPSATRTSYFRIASRLNRSGGLPDVDHNGVIGDDLTKSIVRMFGGYDICETNGGTDCYHLHSPSSITNNTSTISWPSTTTSGSLGFIVATGTSALNVALIAAGACAATVTTAATGTLTTDVISFSPNAAVTAGTNGSLIVHAFPTANNVNFQVCNPTAGGITPPAETLNWRVVR